MVKLTKRTTYPCSLEAVESKTIIQSIDVSNSEAEVAKGEHSTSLFPSEHSNRGDTKQQVRFSDVSIRLFDVTCTGVVAQGPSIGLDWFYTDSDSSPLDYYEESRLPHRKQPEEGLKLTAFQRKTLLIQKHGYSRKDLMQVFRKQINSSSEIGTSAKKNAFRTNTIFFYIISAKERAW
eukprot:CAMPEP_0119013048 /NCGR_PEP_ID=MMETSP1176-20130426/7777_1 /TAXON_ID=265551 /ORGANISM="Synedropsis recta cf, Strain CCMP1620" /LENGTH=177 /DNA_ID=CAMNT_0006966097 /DNA_START=80 /DNA_END=609 /DNA_ORIENTATION=+